MKRVIITAILCILISHLRVNAGIYQYEDKDGTVIMTDRPEKVPEKHRSNMPESLMAFDNETSKDHIRHNEAATSDHESCRQLEEYLGVCRRNLQEYVTGKRPEGLSEDEFIVFVHEICGNTLLQSKLTEQEKAKVRELSGKAVEAEKRISPKKLFEAKTFVKMMYEDCYEHESKVYSRQELDNIGIQFSQIWKEMTSALAANDIKKAIQYYHEMVQEAYQKQYEFLSTKDLIKFAVDISTAQIFVEEVHDDTTAVCQLTPIHKGTRYSFQLTFGRGLDNKWKILSF